MTKNFNLQSARKENGVFIITGPHGEIHYKSLQCAHCGLHWQVEKAADEGGWCLHCMKPICSKEICLRECVPYEAQIEVQEGNKRAIMRYKGTQTVNKIFQDIAKIERKYGKGKLDIIV